MNKGNGIHLAESSRGRFTSIGVAGTSVPGIGIDGRGATPLPVPWFAGTGWAAVLCAAYPALAAAPMIAMHVLRPEAGHPVAAEFGINCALVGFMLLSMQFVLTARLSWIEAPFGLDLVLRFHRAMALVIVALLCAHPLLLASAESWTLLTRFKAHWPLWAGRIALGLLVVQVAAALLRGATRMSYERWRRAHNAIALSILGLGFAHAVRMGHGLHGRALVTAIALPPVLALAALLYSRGIRPRLLARQAFRVHSVRPESPWVWTVTLDAPAGRSLRFRPGQFQFVRFLDSALPAEEHPFTIASSPATPERISLTIKACGNFTDLIDRIRPGDRATVQGPFGRFSHELHPGEGQLVFVAGGVGITPLMSMLRAMRDRHEARRVTLIYASRMLDDVLFTPEMIAMESVGHPALNVVHVLSEPPFWWTGEAGRIDARRIIEWCGGLDNKAFYLCCPPRMNAALVRGLRRRGVSPHRIHCDYFSL